MHACAYVSTHQVHTHTYMHKHHRSHLCVHQSGMAAFAASTFSSCWLNMLLVNPALQVHIWHHPFHHITSSFQSFQASLLYIQSMKPTPFSLLFPSSSNKLFLPHGAKTCRQAVGSNSQDLMTSGEIFHQISSI